jgi:signal transduction histidine kinase
MQITSEVHVVSSMTPDNLLCQMDEHRIEQVIRNLLSNAIKYMPHGGPCSIVLEQVGNEAVITVTDDGIGIPKESLPHLFNQYYRADNVGTNINTAISGLGVGLYVSSEIVKQHGGTITALSDGLYKGATFIVRLPL